MKTIYLILICSILAIFSCQADEFKADATGQAGLQNDSKDDVSLSSWSDAAQEIIINALSLTGVKYKYGGISPDTGFDCSGFVRYVFQQAANLTLPHGARAISQLGQVVAQENLQPGDLVFFKTVRSTFSHVGIYIGNNRFIHSPSKGETISVTSLDDHYWSKRYSGARRIDLSDTVEAKPANPQ